MDADLAPDAAPPPIEFDPDTGLLLVAGRTAQLRPRTAALLARLLRSPGQIVQNRILLSDLWPGVVVTDDSLFQCVREIREALGSSHAGLLRNVPRRGYSFVGPALLLSRSHRNNSEISYATSADGTRLAVCRHGAGQAVLRAGNYIAQAGIPADDPLLRPFIDAFTTPHAYVTFDQRGCGLSQREVRDISFEAWVADLAAVVEHLKLPRVTLFGMSQGCAIAVAYAARHPDRIHRLLLHGGYARHQLCSTDPQTLSRAATEMEIARVGWSLPTSEFRHFWVHRLIPDAPLALQERIAERQKSSLDGNTMTRGLTAIHAIDVRAEAPAVRCPTLVTHFAGDRNVPIALGSELAGLIPSARFVCLPGNNHAPLHAGESWRGFIEVARRFLAKQ